MQVTDEKRKEETEEQFSEPFNEQEKKIVGYNQWVDGSGKWRSKKREKELWCFKSTGRQSINVDQRNEKDSKLKHYQKEHRSIKKMKENIF